VSETLCKFTVKPLQKIDTYYGFSLFENDKLYKTYDDIIHHNSGKSVLEQGIVGHVSRYPDKFQLVGIDVKRVEFNLLRGVRGIKGIALDVQTSAATIQAFQQVMMQRFKFMEDAQVNNIYNIENKEVDYYELWDQKFQFDEIFELTVDLDERDKNYNKLLLIYPEKRIPKILTIEEIYKGLQKDEFKNPQLPEIKGYNSYIAKNSIRKTRGIFIPKVLLLLADELNELMNSDDYRAVDTIKQCFGSIARLGRAAATHLALACQRASGGTISSDLKNNIQMSILLGAFDSGASTLMFEKDITDLAKPEIKGRGFLQSGNEIIETQTYFIKPERDWVFDENLKMTYNNPVFLEQKEKRNEPINDSGWVAQYKLDSNEEEINLYNDLDSDDQDIDELLLDTDLFDEELEEDQKPIIDFKFGSGKSIRAKLEEEIKEKTEFNKINQEEHIVKLPKLNINKEDKNTTKFNIRKE
jgi:hypothetical protein